MDILSALPATADVVVLGGGPTGLMLANLLGLCDVRAVVIERDAEVYPIPRATHIDEETMRHFQLTGLMPWLEPFTSPFGEVQLLDEDGKPLFREEIAQHDTEHFYQGSRFFDQPAFERALRKGLERFPHITFLAGYEAESIEPTAADVTVAFRNRATNQAYSLRSRWLVGADGGRSLVRTTLDLKMEALEPARDWVIVDTVLKDPADAALLPEGFRYIFDPSRLSIFASGHGLNNRWEFQLGRNEAMPDEAEIRSWVARYIPLEKITITRIAKYAHHSLVVQHWRRGHCLLAGDAAHMMPPTAGQGMCSGVRDAVNLAWKLAAVLKGEAEPSLLDTYEQERRPHLYDILRRTLFFSSRLQGDDPLQRMLRHVQLRAIELIKPLKDYLRRSYNTPPRLLAGCLSKHSVLAGHHLPQYVLNDHTLTDDHLGYRWLLVTRPLTLTETQLQAARRHGVQLLPTEQPDLSNVFTAWLNRHHVDFALIRPDKVVFGAGHQQQFSTMLQELKALRHERAMKLTPA